MALWKCKFQIIQTSLHRGTSWLADTTVEQAHFRLWLLSFSSPISHALHFARFYPSRGYGLSILVLCHLGTLQTVLHQLWNFWPKDPEFYLITHKLLTSEVFPILLTETFERHIFLQNGTRAISIGMQENKKLLDAHLYIPESSNLDIARTSSFSQKEQALLGQSYFSYTIVSFNWAG